MAQRVILIFYKNSIYYILLHIITVYNILILLN